MLWKAIFGGAVVVLAVAIVMGRPEFKRYRIPSESMEPTIRQGETVSLNRTDDLNVGDIVIFNPPAGADSELSAMCGVPPKSGQACAERSGGRAARTFIKRIVAGPGDRIAFDHGRVVLNGRPQKEPYITACGGGEACELPRPITVSDGSFYLVGDNRGASDDSRFWGPVPKEWILGRVDRCRAIYFLCSAV